MTHPVQYYSPWFAHIDREAAEIDLRVLYVAVPTAAQQGAGFDESFEWANDLRAGYESEVLRPTRPSDRFESRSFWGLDAPGIAAAIERGDPDVVLMMGWHCLALVRAIVACRRRTIPLVYRGDTTGSKRSGVIADGLWRLRTSWLLSRFDRYLSVGVRVREHLGRFGVPEDKVFRSPHAVDNAFFARAAEPYRDFRARAIERIRLGIRPEDFVVIFVGKLEAQKRLDDLVRAVATLRDECRLLVVGNGPLLDASAACASQHGVSVRFQGFVNQPTLPLFYAVSDCLVVPSESETWGLVVNEAMATGLPCIVSDRVGCAPDLIEPGHTGEVFPKGDVAALTEALRRLLIEKRQGVNRVESCLDKVSGYSFQTATAGLVAACQSIVGQ